MSDRLDDLPPDIIRQVVLFCRDADGTVEVADKMGLLKFVSDNSDRYPALLKLFTLNEEAAIRYVEETGQPIPGVKMIKTTTAEGSNVTRLKIFQDSSRSTKSDHG